MQLSPPVSAFLDVLDRMSHQSCVRRDDLGALLEAAFQGGKEKDLSALAFTGKFCVRTLAIMKRIGAGGEPYERLAGEFGRGIDSARQLLGVLLAAMPEETRTALGGRYLPLHAGGLDELLALLADLSWIKNWEIDNPGKKPW
jgi:hypothetical protein